jgi:anthranilate phosphoribosyltransferase
MSDHPEARMTAYLKRVASGPTKSKDLTREEARDGMEMVLRRELSDVQAGVFLVALRMKRESDDEHRGILEALRAATQSVTVPIPDLVEISDPYDGFKRHPPTSPFLLPLLAACGLPAISTGCSVIGPKFGVTHRQIFEKSTIPTLLTPAEAARRVAHPAIGWAYIDQSVFCPTLYNLIELRRLIVKRPCIATLEKMCGPVRAEKNHLFIGYVHHGYEEQIPMAARHGGYDSCLTVKGVEGGVLLPMNKPQSGYLYTHREAVTREIVFDPAEAGVTTTLRSVPLPPDCKEAASNDPVAEASARLGIAVLSGVDAGADPLIAPARDSLIFTASAVLVATGRTASLAEAAKSVRHALDSGTAFAHLVAGRGSPTPC